MTRPSHDPTAPIAAPNEPLPSGAAEPTAWARTTTAPTPPSPYAAASGPAGDAAGPVSAPALTPPTWSGKKTAVAAALALGLSSIGAVAAAAALPAGVQGSVDGRGGPGQFAPGGGRQPGQGMPGPSDDGQGTDAT